MISGFEVVTPSHIRFGAGVVHDAPRLIEAFGKAVFLVHGRDRDRVPDFLRTLSTDSVAMVGEPTFSVVGEAAKACRAANAEVVVAIGGGSVLDAGKAIAMLATNGGDPHDYAEVIGHGRAISQPSLPMIAIPTTAGTGSEATRNAVLLSPDHGVKVSLRAASMIPRIALIDPGLMVSMPATITAATGMDALSQVIEPYVSCRANPYTDALCREALRRVGRSLRRAYTHPDDLSARADMALAGLFGGLALANAGLGAVHGLAAPIGGQFSAPHGAVCAALLAPVMRANLHAAADGDLPDLAARFTDIARDLTGDPQAAADDGIAWVRETAAILSIPSLETYGIRTGHVKNLVALAAKASSMKGNPVPLSENALADVLIQAGVHPIR